MGILTMWQVHKNLTNKSLAQTRQCKWLVEMELILGYGLTLNSLYSHHSIWEKVITVLLVVYFELHHENYIEFLFLFQDFQVGVSKFLSCESYNFACSKLSHMSSNSRVSNYKNLDKMFPNHVACFHRRSFDICFLGFNG